MEIIDLRNKYIKKINNNIINIKLLFNNYNNLIGGSFTTPTSSLHVNAREKLDDIVIKSDEVKDKLYKKYDEIIKSIKEKDNIINNLTSELEITEKNFKIALNYIYNLLKNQTKQFPNINESNIDTNLQNNINSSLVIVNDYINIIKKNVNNKTLENLENLEKLINDNKLSKDNSIKYLKEYIKILNNIPLLKQPNKINLTEQEKNLKPFKIRGSDISSENQKNRVRKIQSTPYSP